MIKACRPYSTLLEPAERLARVQETLNRLETQQQSWDCLVRLLQTCINLRAFAEGKRLHAYVASRGMDSKPQLGIPLLSLYYKCRALKEARCTFDRLETRCNVAWTMLVGAYAQAGQPAEAFGQFRQMQLEGVRPNDITLVTILNACTRPCDLIGGSTFRSIAGELAIESNPRAMLLVSNALISMYSKCGSLDEALGVFRTMPQRDVISWTSIISAFARYEGLEGEALQCFSSMQLEGLVPNRLTLSIVLNLCARTGRTSRGAAIHTTVAESGWSLCAALCTSLVNLYGRGRRWDDAVQAFESTTARTPVTWNALITALVQAGAHADAVHLYGSMALEGVKANKVTFVTILNACDGPAALRLGRSIHSCVDWSGYGDDVIVGNALITMYDACGSLGEAEATFRALSTARNTISWNAMLTAIAQRGGGGGRAQQLLRWMIWEGTPPSKVTFVTLLNSCTSSAQLRLIHSLVAERGDEFDTIVGSALLNLHGKHGSIEEARRIFDGMHQRDVVAWNGMLAAYAHTGHYREALDLFHEMTGRAGQVPNDITVITMLEASANEVDLEVGRKIHTMVPDFHERAEIGVGIAIVNLYGKCGRVREAKSCFDMLPYRDVVLWTSIIAAYAQHGHPREAVRLVKLMQQEGVEPNRITMVSVLSACSHAGLVEEAYHYFLMITRERQVEAMVEHYRCVVDLLARAGMLDEAEGFLKRVPIDPGPVAWMTLLAACKSHGDVGRARRAAGLAIKLCPASSAGYVALSNAFAALEEEGNEMEEDLLRL